MIKLKDELANSRVEILRTKDFREPIDIAEMHWNDCHKPILELIGFAKPQSQSARRGVEDKSTPIDVDFEIIDIIGAERAKQLYPELMGGNMGSRIPPHKSGSAPNSFSSYSKRHSVGFSNLDLSADFPTRNKEPTVKTCAKGADINEDELRAAGLKTALLLAEEKNDKYDRKVKQLEEELKKVYQYLIKSETEKKGLQKKCDTLNQQLDKVLSKGGSSSAANNRDDDRDVQVIREVQTNRERKRRALLRNPHIPPWKASILPRPFQRRVASTRVGAGINKSNGNRQRPMVFTNSNRLGNLNRLNDVLNESQGSQQAIYRTIYHNNKTVPKVDNSSQFNRLRSVLNEGQGSNMRQFVEPFPSRLDFGRAIDFSSASRRSYPPGILPAPSFLSSFGDRDLYSGF